MRNAEELLRRLADHGVAFVVSGGFAAVAHGSSHVTQDIDVVYERSETNLARVLDALSGLSPRHRMVVPPRTVAENAAELATLRDIYLVTDAGILDLVGEVTGLGEFAVAKSRSVDLDLWGIRCAVLDLDALIDAKRALGREKDEEVLLELEAIRSRR